MKILFLFALVAALTWTALSLESSRRNLSGRYRPDFVAILLWMVLAIITIVWMISYAAEAAELHVKHKHHARAAQHFTVGKTPMPRDKPAEPISRALGTP